MELSEVSLARRSTTMAIIVMPAMIAKMAVEVVVPFEPARVVTIISGRRYIDRREGTVYTGAGVPNWTTTSTPANAGAAASKPAVAAITKRRFMIFLLIARLLRTWPNACNPRVIINA